MMLFLVLLAAVFDDEEEAQILLKAIEGDREAYGRLVSKYQKRVFRVARRLCGSDDDAWDITQESFIRAMNAMGSFDPGFRFFTWIYRIVTNVAINSHRKTGRRAEVEYQDEHGYQGQTVTLDQAPLNAAADELALLVGRAVEALSDPLRTVFVLRVDQELSYTEIAETLGIAVGTVMSRLNRARNQVRAMIGHELEGAGS
ncbi:MAG: sigma-70 family RNA polymerase sigma factor [Candidatus Fermentibacteraceae bacterium]